MNAQFKYVLGIWGEEIANPTHCEAASQNVEPSVNVKMWEI